MFASIAFLLQDNDNTVQIRSPWAVCGDLAGARNGYRDKNA